MSVFEDDQRRQEWREWIERARRADILLIAQKLGARLKRIGANEYAGPCPRCGGTDRFSVNTKKRVYNCRGEGEGGDVIAMVQLVTEMFATQCEALHSPSRSAAPPSASATGVPIFQVGQSALVDVALGGLMPVPMLIDTGCSSMSVTQGAAKAKFLATGAIALS